jgi:hypothetical protein
VSSDSDDHFSDAQSARAETPVPASPVPKTRVEKVDNEPSYGEVPGTDAYEKRTGDAAPDEIAVVEDPTSATPALDASSAPPERPTTPGGQPIPKTVLDEAADEPGAEPRHSHEHLHEADALPDEVRKADGTGETKPVPAALETTGEAPGTAAKSS